MLPESELIITYAASSKQADRNYNLELFFEISADLLCIAGFDCYFKKVNPSLIKLLGYTESGK